MPKLHVTLSEVLQALGGPLEEPALWALLHQTSAAVHTALADHHGAGLLITPESVLLHPGGSVSVLPGLHDGTESKLRAPETAWESPRSYEKSYVYSLGATLLAAMENHLEEGQEPQVTADLQDMLQSMVAREPSSRPTLTDVTAAAAKQIHDSGAAEVDTLATYVLGSTHDQVSSGDEVDISEENLDSEMQAAINMQTFGSRERLYSPSYGNRSGSSLSLASQGSQSVHSSALSLQRSSSVRSMPGAGRDGLSSSLPQVYYSSLQEGLNSTHHWPGGAAQASWAIRGNRYSLHEPLALSLQLQDISALACKARSSSRQLPPDPQTEHMPHSAANLRRAVSLSSGSSGFYRSRSDGQQPMLAERHTSTPKPPAHKATATEQPPGSSQHEPLPPPVPPSLPPPTPPPASPLAFPPPPSSLSSS